MIHSPATPQISFMTRKMKRVHTLAAVLSALGAAAFSHAQTGAFVNFESPQSHPIGVTPDGTTLLAVNTADGQLEVFDLVSGLPVRRGAVAVGVDPVSVRARSSSEAWVVNQISDSVSVVDLPSMRVVRTINVGDEPADIVFTAKPARAFVSLAASSKLVSFDPSLAVPVLTSTAILGASPRALAVSPDGTKVYLAVFESGNKTTVIPRTIVNSAAGPYAGVNPPPNSGTLFDPPRTVGQPNPPRVAHIVRKNAANQWLDDNNRNWTSLVTWGVVDNDIAVVNASTLATTYVPSLMTCVASIGVANNGTIFTVGIEARRARLFLQVAWARRRLWISIPISLTRHRAFPHSSVGNRSVIRAASRGCPIAARSSSRHLVPIASSRFRRRVRGSRALMSAKDRAELSRRLRARLSTPLIVLTLRSARSARARMSRVRAHRFTTRLPRW